MHVTVFAANPDTCGNFRGIAYEPAVGVVVGGSCLACNLALEVVNRPQTGARSFVHDALHHLCHKVGELR